MSTFNADKTLSKTKPETILKWAIKKLRANCKTAQANEVVYESKLNDEDFKRTLGKRELKKLETGKATLAELRKAKLDAELASYAEETEKAIQNLTAAFSKELPAVIDISVDWKKHRVWRLQRPHRKQELSRRRLRLASLKRSSAPSPTTLPTRKAW